METLISDRSRQLLELCSRIDESSSVEITNKKAFEDEMHTSLNTILASDDSRRASFQLSHEEEQQNVAVCGTYLKHHYYVYALGLVWFGSLGS